MSTVDFEENNYDTQTKIPKQRGIWKKDDQ